MSSSTKGDKPRSPNWGGPRPGAGRRALEPKKQVAIRLSAREREALEALGNGHVSDGVRFLLSYYAQHGPSEPQEPLGGVSSA